MAPNLSKLIDRLIKDDKVLTRRNQNVLFCEACDTELTIHGNNAKSTIIAHKKTIKHTRNYALWTKDPLIQKTLIETSDAKNIFFERLARLFIALNIPFYRLNHPELRLFIEDYCRKVCPDESTLRKYYLKPLYDETMHKIVREIDGSPFYIQIDESTMYNRRIVAVLVGKLNGQKPHSMLFNLVELNEAPNHANIQQVVINSLHLIMGDDFDYERFRLLLSDQAAYMLAAGNTLKTIFPKLLHVTCLCHALNRVSSLAQEIYPQVDLLVTKFRKVFCKKSLYRKALLEDILQEKIPTGPCKTRWGTWITFCIFLCGKLDKIHDALIQLDDTTIPGYSILLKLVKLDSIQDELLDVRDLQPIVDKIKLLEQNGLTIDQQRGLIVELRSELPDKYRYKLDSSLCKNPDFDTVFKNLSRDDRATTYLYAPLTSVDVERSFSVLKWMFSDRRTRFAPENLKHYVITMANSVIVE